MQAIFKYALDLAPVQRVEMPNGAQVLAVQTQAGMPCIWALVDTERKLKPRTFHILGTGNAADDASPERYVGTVQLHGGALVLHVFEA